MGNLHSVAKALEAAGAPVVVSDDRARLGKTDVLVVPGQGRFDSAMTTLRRRGLVSLLKDWLKAGRPYLGVCLGLQILFDGSDEAPGTPGLGWIPGRVRRFAAGKGLKVPHVGWNRVRPVSGQAGELFEGDAHYYFVHSFYPAPKSRGWIGAETPYGNSFCSGVARGPVVATQFHPEKSGAAGLVLLRKMVKIWSGR